MSWASWRRGGKELTGDFPDDERGQEGVREEEEGEEPSRVFGIGGEVDGGAVEGASAVHWVEEWVG